MIKIQITLRIILFCLPFAFSTLQAFALEGTELVIYDLCSNRNIEVSSRKTIGLAINIRGLIPHHPVWLEISLSPANHAANPTDKHLAKKITETLKIGETDTLSLKRKIKLYNHQKHRFERDLSQTWNIQLTWIQPSTLRSGSTSKTIQFVESAVKRLYSITGPMSCVWETPTDLDSQLYFNHDQDRMEVSRQESVHPGVSFFRGLDGVFQEHYRLVCPYLIPPTHIGPEGPYGWFYPSAQKITLVDTVKKMVQKWTLSRGESGVFGQRLTFQRFPAAEYQKISSHGCSHWEQVKRGLLDLGAASNEFIMIPVTVAKELQSHPARIVQFLETERPRLNTCDPSLLSESHIQTRSQVGTEGLIYFYPENGES